MADTIMFHLLSYCSMLNMHVKHVTVRQ